MAVSRRIFLQRGFFAAAACAGSPLLALNGGRHLQVNDGEQSLAPTLPHQSNNWQDHAAALDGLDRNMFAAAVGSNFKVYLTSGSPVWLTLLAVEDLPATAPANPGSFAVSPKGPSFAPSSNGLSWSSVDRHLSRPPRICWSMTISGALRSFPSPPLTARERIRGDKPAGKPDRCGAIQRRPSRAEQSGSSGHDERCACHCIRN